MTPLRLTDPAPSAGEGPASVTTPEDPVTTTQSGDGGGQPPPETDRAQGESKPHKRQRSFWRELPFLIVIALVLALLIKTFLVQAFYIPSASMENTLQGGPFPGSTGSHPYDRVLVNKLVYRFRDPHRGEIVVFKKPSYWASDFPQPTTTGVVHYLQDLESDVGIPVNNTEDIIKRVIGVPGDHVQCKPYLATNGKPVSGRSILLVNGHRLDEPYLYPGSNECYAGSYFNVTVPAGHLWVMGDHRDDSSDSRANMANPQHGTIPINNVVGRAFAVIWPPKNWKTLPVPKTFDQPGLAAAAAGGAPAALGLAAAVPLTVLRRRRIRRGRRSLVGRLLRRP